jgi:hypothetical protein
MSRRREANRAEAIVRGIGGLVMVVVLAIMVYAVPQFLKGKDSQDAIKTALNALLGFTALGLTIGVVGLVVWWRVKNRSKR